MKSHCLHLLGVCSLLIARVAAADVTAFVPCDPLDANFFCSPPTSVTQGGVPYISVSGLLTGCTQRAADGSCAPENSYAAPLALLYPEDGADCGGTAIVDLVNNSGTLFVVDGLGFFPPVAGGTTLMGEDFIGRRGHVVAQLQYQGFVDPDQVTVGSMLSVAKSIGFYPQAATIPPTFEAAKIVAADAAAFLRHPFGADAPTCRASKVLAYGLSRSAQHLRHFLQDGLASYDGSLLHGLPGSGIGWTAPPGPTPRGTGKTIVLNSESDLALLQSESVRDTAGRGASHYRVYEVAGVSHALAEGALIPDTRQNLARVSPVVRGVFDHLEAWRAGAQPPPSAYLDLRACELQELPLFAPFPPQSTVGVLACATGPEGAMKGGVRLPHVTSLAGGAPLGCYSGVETYTPYAVAGVLPLASTIFALLGVHDASSCISLPAAYPNHGVYVLKVFVAASYARLRGWIGDEDLLGYVQIAAACPVGSVTSLSFEQQLACHGL